MRSPTSRPAALRASCTARTSSRARPSARSSGVSSSSSATVMPPSLATPQPSIVSWTRSTSPGASSIARPWGAPTSRRTVSPRASAAASDPSSRFERRRRVLDPGSEPWAEDLEVRLGAPAPELVGGLGEQHLLHVQLLGDQVQERLEGGVVPGVVDDGLQQRLADAHLGLGADPAAELDDLADRGHRVVERRVHQTLVRRRVVGQVHGVRRAVATGGQVAPQGLRDERGERGEQLGQADEARVQRVERRAHVVASIAGRVPEPTAGPAHVPVRQVLDERGDPPARAGGVVRLRGRRERPPRCARAARAPIGRAGVAARRRTSPSDGSNPLAFAYVTKNAYTFHSGNRNWRTTSSNISMLTRRGDHGEPPVSRNQRSASAPCRSITSNASTVLPSDFDILRPSRSTRWPRHTTVR